MKAFVELLLKLLYKLFVTIVGGRLINFIGCSLRWLYGTIWRTIFHRPKFTFREYLYGPKKSEDWFDQTGHRFVNILVGLLGGALIIYGLGSLIDWLLC